MKVPTPVRAALVCIVSPAPLQGASYFFTRDYFKNLKLVCLPGDILGLMYLAINKIQLGIFFFFFFYFIIFIGTWLSP